MEEGKGLLRASFNYNTFCIIVGMEGAVSSHLLLPENGENGKSEETSLNHPLLQQNDKNVGVEGTALNHI